MRETITTLMIALLTLGLSGCGRSCEGIEEDIVKITREIQKKPDTAWDRAEELQSLKAELEEKGCIASAP